MRISFFRPWVGVLAWLLAVPAFALTQLENELLRSIKEAKEKDDLPKALTIANLLVEKSPELGLAYYERADVELKLNQLDAAAQDVEKLIKLSPQATYATFLRAKIRMARFDYGGALDDAQHSVRSTEGAELCGEILMALGRYAEARGCYEYLMGGQFGPYTNAQFPRGMCWLGLGKPDEAVGWFDVVYSDTGYLPALFQGVICRIELGQYDEVEKSLATWLEPGPEPTDSYDLYKWKNLRGSRGTAVYLGGVVRFARGDFAGAVAKLDQVAPDDEMSDDARLLRHVALVRMKRPDDALKTKGDLKDDWARVLGRYLRGELKEKELLKVALDSPDLIVRRARQSAAGFFAGQVRLAAGDDLAAGLLFEKAESAKAIDSAVYALTKVAQKDL